MLAVAACVAAAGCKSHDAEQREQQRQKLLTGQDLNKDRDERLAKLRYTDDQGNLLPSDTTVAGVVLPRGFKSKFTFKYEWYYDGEQPLDKLEQYLVKTVTGSTVTRPDKYSVAFTRDKTPERVGIVVTIYPVPGRSDWSRMHIVSSRPPPDHYATAAEIQEELERRAKYAR